MPRGIRTSNIAKNILVKELCNIINVDMEEVFNQSNGTITKELLQEICSYFNFPNRLNKAESANYICKELNLACDNIDFNINDGTVSAGFIEKIITHIKQ